GQAVHDGSLNAGAVLLGDRERAFAHRGDRVISPGDLRDDHGELLTPDSTRDVRLARPVELRMRDVVEDAAELCEDRVADIEPEDTVDLAEVVDVREDEAELAAVAASALKLGIEHAGEVRAIEEPRGLVDEVRRAELLLAL